jgi:hypothetical protein
MAVRLDRFTFTPRRAERTPEGYLRCDATVARAGILEYPQPDGRVVREYRPPEEASNPQSLATFGGKAVTLEHPPEMLNAENTRQYAVGFTGTEVVYDQGFVRVVVTITDKEAIDAVLRGDAVEVSAGYEVDIVETPGVTPDGQAYDAIQKNIRCNHIALTRRGRAGPEVRLHLDKKEANKMAQLTLDNAVFEVPEAVAAAVATHLRAQRRDQEEEEEKEKKFGALLEGMGTRLERLEACSEKMRKDQEEIQMQLGQVLNTLQQLLARLEAMLPPQEAQAGEPEVEEEEKPSTETLDSLVEERFRVVAAARKILGDSYDWRGRSTEDIRLDALRAAGIPTEGHTSEYLRARFDALVESAGVNSLRSALDSLPVAAGGLLQVRPPSNPPRFAYQK